MSKHEEQKQNLDDVEEVKAESTEDAKAAKGDGKGNPRSGKSIPKIILGVLILFVGLMMLLENLDVGADYLWRLLPLIVVIIGVAKVIGASANSQRFLGGLIIFTGVIWLSGMWMLWPLAIMLFGLFVVWRALGGRSGVPYSGRTVTHSDYLRDFVVFGSSERRMESPNFKGGDLTAVFGGVDLDLRSCPAPQGEAPVLELFVLFGGIDIRVPDSWVVSQEATAMFGGIEDTTRPPVGGSPDAASPPRLILKGVVLFGGIDIKN